jgi:hypothetical protein
LSAGFAGELVHNGEIKGAYLICQA